MSEYNTATNSLSNGVEVAISRLKFIGKPDRLDWAQLNDSFENQFVTPMTLMNNIYQGHPFCPQMTGRRKEGNFHSAQYIGIDMDSADERSALTTIEQHKLYRQYSALAYETPNSTPEKPRSRVLFFLEQPFEDATKYKAAIDTMTAMFEGADPACVDSTRFFYGNGRLEQEGRSEGIIFNDQPRITIPQLRMHYQQVQSERKTSNVGPSPHYSQSEPQHRSDHGSWSAEGVLSNILHNALTGNRNNLGFWYACKLAENNISRSEAEQWMLKYQAAVQSAGTARYTQQEAMSSLSSAYR